MRRGLISWSKAELPERVLDARIARVQAAMAAAGIDVLAVYTNPARESGVAWFTGFIPYWNQCVMLLPRAGRPMLVAGMTARVRDWIMRNAHIADVANTTKLGAETGRLIAERKPAAVVAIPDLDSVPGSVVNGIRSNAATVIDGSALLEQARAAADPAEVALAFKAASIAHAALACARASEIDGASLVAVIDGEARRLGAEEVFVALAPDLASGRRLVRLEGTAPLGPAFAARLSLAYKGTWVRMLRTFGRGDMLTQDIAGATAGFAAAIAMLPRTDQLERFAAFLVEGCRTTTPLEPLTGTMLDDRLAIAPGSVVSVQATIETNGRAILVGAPVLVGRNGEAASALVTPQFNNAG
jgi:Creatinase/Prolidase N-terminal domain